MVKLCPNMEGVKLVIMAFGGRSMKEIEEKKREERREEGERREGVGVLYVSVRCAQWF